MINIIIFGPPGAGKGTQAELISKKFGLRHLSSGDLLRQARQDKILGPRIKKYQDSGRLVPDTLIIKMLEAAVAKNWRGAGFIFDGYPRNLRQARSLDNFFKHKKSQLDLVLNLQLGAKEAAKRIILRGQNSGRSDDNRQTVLNRFRIYRAQTAPLLSYYQQQKKLINIDGRPNIKEVYKQILAVLKNLS